MGELPRSATEELPIPDVMSKEYLRIRNEEGIVPSKTFYFDHLMPLIRPWLEQQPEHQRLRKKKYSTLVSLMGFSPETTVHTTLILRPKRLVIAYSENARESARPAIRYLTDENIIDQFDIEPVPVDPFDAVSIYDCIQAKLATSEGTVFDITGGTKLMSATAGALAWEKNLSLCYLNGNWDPAKGAAGLGETIRLLVLPNPSRSRGFQYRRDALKNYQRGDFVAAAEGFESSVKLIDESHFDQLGLRLCQCYCTFKDFNSLGQ